MSADLASDVLETERLVLRPRRVDDAASFRALWTERDQRVPPHRRIDDRGRPTVADLAARKLGFRETGDVEPDPGYGDTVLTVREF